MLKCILQLCSQTFRVKFQDSLNYILHILLFLRSFNDVNSFDLQMVSEIGHSEGAPIYCLVMFSTKKDPTYAITCISGRLCSPCTFSKKGPRKRVRLEASGPILRAFFKAEFVFFAVASWRIPRVDINGLWTSPWQRSKGDQSCFKTIQRWPKLAKRSQQKQF